MQLVFRTLSHNAPNALTDFWHYFSIHQYKKWETCTGLPSSGGTSRSTSDCRTLGGRGEAGVNKPVHWADLFTDPYRLYTQIKTHGTDLPFEQAAKAINSCFCSFPLSSGLCTICTRQHLLSSFTFVLPALKTLQIPACTRTPSPGKGNQHMKKGKGKPFNTFSNNHDHNVMI